VGNIISIDPGWKEKTRRNAVVVAKPRNQICLVASRLGDSDLISLVRDYAEPESLVLLDIPIEGCENLCEPRRPVENVLQHYIALYPATMAGMRGIKLKKKLLQAIPEGIRTSVIIQETYPHAVYKFLWVARQKGKLESVRSGRWKRFLARGFIPSLSPPKYKGNITYDQRLAGMRDLYNLLTGHMGLSFLQPLDFPDESLSSPHLELIADELDACLGAVAGLYCAVHNQYVWVAGDQSGEILLLADRWLKEQLEKDGAKMRHLWLP